MDTNSQICITVEPLIKDPSRKGQPLYKGHFQYPQNCIYMYNSFSTSEKRTAFLQGTKWLIPKCPLLGGSLYHTIIALIDYHTIMIIIYRNAEE